MTTAIVLILATLVGVSLLLMLPDPCDDDRTTTQCMLDEYEENIR